MRTCPSAISAPGPVHEAVQHDVQVHRLPIVHQVRYHRMHLVAREAHVCHVINHLQVQHSGPRTSARLQTTCTGTAQLDSAAVSPSAHANHVHLLHDQSAVLEAHLLKGHAASGGLAGLPALGPGAGARLRRGRWHAVAAAGAVAMAARLRGRRRRRGARWERRPQQGRVRLQPTCESASQQGPTLDNIYMHARGTMPQSLTLTLDLEATFVKGVCYTIACTGHWVWSAAKAAQGTAAHPRARREGAGARHEGGAAVAADPQSQGAAAAASLACIAAHAEAAHAAMRHSRHTAASN